MHYTVYRGFGHKTKMLTKLKRKWPQTWLPKKGCLSKYVRNFFIVTSNNTLDILVDAENNADIRDFITKQLMESTIKFIVRVTIQKLYFISRNVA